MRDAITTVAVCFLCSVAAAQTQPDEPQQYLVKARLYEISQAGSTTLTNVKADEMKTSPLSGATTLFFTELEMQSPMLNVVINGPKLHIAPVASAVPGAAARLVSRPSLVSLSGERATISVGQEGAQYFTRRADGLFELEECGTQTGFSLGVTVQPVDEDPERVQLDIHIDFAQVAEREPIEGVMLNVGRPTISQYVVDAKLQVRLGDWLGILHVVPDRSALLICAKVTHFRSGQSATPQPDAPN